VRDRAEPAVTAREYNFDGLVGPTHNYAGLSAGNNASTNNQGRFSNPRAAALQGLRKMRFVHALGVGQAVLPPQPRPSLGTLLQLGFHGSDEEILAAASQAPQLLRMCSSAAAMWTANAATVAPSADTSDGRVHLTPANLQAMFHRAIEAETTTRVLRSIYADASHFTVHDPLPGGGQFADEGAANHTRLFTSKGRVHLFGWGRSVWTQTGTPTRHPARQTLEASAALARLHQLSSASVLLAHQHPEGIDAGAFHTDVLAVGNGSFLMLHELAFEGWSGLELDLRRRLGDELAIEWVSDVDLPVAEAVQRYPFNSQVVTLPDGSMAIIAPADAERSPATKAFLDRVVAGRNPVRAVHYLDVRESMDNGGGPACLRLRVTLTDVERAAISARVFLDDAFFAELEAWVTRHYRDRLGGDDLADPSLWREGLTALDELTRMLRLGSVYDFQRSP
jgi:succinylarginine dihydrolase